MVRCAYVNSESWVGGAERSETVKIKYSSRCGRSFQSAVRSGYPRFRNSQAILFDLHHPNRAESFLPAESDMKSCLTRKAAKVEEGHGHACRTCSFRRHPATDSAASCSAPTDRSRRKDSAHTSGLDNSRSRPEARWLGRVTQPYGCCVRFRSTQLTCRFFV
jgi:hypothetical protein